MPRVAALRPERRFNQCLTLHLTVSAGIAARYCPTQSAVAAVAAAAVDLQSRIPPPVGNDVSMIKQMPNKHQICKQILALRVKELGGIFLLPLLAFESSGKYI